MTGDRLREIAPLLADRVTELDAVAVAIAVEDGWGITLSDDEISPARLGTAEAIMALLQQHGVGP